MELDRWHSGEGWCPKGQESSKRDRKGDASKESNKPGENNIMETKFGERGEKVAVKSLHGTDRCRQDDDQNVSVQ